MLDHAPGRSLDVLLGRGRARRYGSPCSPDPDEAPGPAVRCRIRLGGGRGGSRSRRRTRRRRFLRRILGGRIRLGSRLENRLAVEGSGEVRGRRISCVISSSAFQRSPAGCSSPDSPKELGGRKFEHVVRGGKRTAGRRRRLGGGRVVERRVPERCVVERRERDRLCRDALGTVRVERVRARRCPALGLFEGVFRGNSANSGRDLPGTWAGWSGTNEIARVRAKSPDGNDGAGTATVVGEDRGRD